MLTIKKSPKESLLAEFNDRYEAPQETHFREMQEMFLECPTEDNEQAADLAYWELRKYRKQRRKLELAMLADLNKNQGRSEANNEGNAIIAACCLLGCGLIGFILWLLR